MFVTKEQNMKPTHKNKIKKVLFILSAGLVIWYIFCLPRKLFDVSYATVVTDRNHELLGARIAEDNQWRFPAIDTVPPKVKTCLIEFEDQYFYRHWGVNPLAIGRAIIQNIQAKKIVSGGSTLTMQTIRLARREKRTFIEKFIEIVWATRLEFRYSKEEILGLYASHAPFGGNVVGLEAAAWRYFGHSSNNLSWAEAATLAVLPNAPSQIHLSRNRKALSDKRNRLLKKLLDKKLINSSTYELSLNEPLPGEPLPLPSIAPHLVSYFYQQNKGNYCTSTLEKGMQQQVEEILNRWNGDFSRNDIRNLAALVIDVRKNQVIAYCGNVNFESKRSANQVDIIRSPRSTGSILKPFLYCALLQEGILLPHTLQPDIPVNINGFQPQNFNRQFDGAVPASEALARSLNVPAVYELQAYSVPKFYDFLKKAGLTTLNRPASDYGLSLILGGAEGSLWDIASAYNNMAQTLIRTTTHPEQTVNEKPFLLLSESTQNSTQNSMYDPGAVWQTFETIKEVNRPEEIDWKYIPSMQKIAWKTGTSYGFRDAWAIGVTPRYVVGVWVGNANGEGKPGLTGAQTAGPVLFDIFNILPASSWFEIPYETLTEAEICMESGHLKGRYCEHTDTILIPRNGLKTTPCPYHFSVHVTPDNQYRVYENCAGSEGIQTVSWFALPPAWAWYYKQHHPSYRNLPPFKPGCSPDGQHQPMQFIYPQPQANISLPKQLDGSPGQVIFELAHNQPHATVHWHLDENYVGTTENFHQITLRPDKGKHVVTVVDNEGNTLSVSFNIL